MNLILQINSIIGIVFILMCGLGVKTTLEDIRQRVNQEIHMSTKVAMYAVEAQVARLEQELLKEERSLSQWASRFQLADLSEILHVDIELIAKNGQLLDSNRPVVQKSNDILLPDWLENKLKEYLGHKEAIMPIFLTGRHLGDIVIQPNFFAQWKGIRAHLQSSLFPLILIFLIGSILMGIITSVVLKPISEMLPQKNKSPAPLRSAFDWFHLNQLLTASKHLQSVKQRYLDSDQKIAILNQQLIQIQEAERKRLSAELHDEIGQHLTAIHFDLSAIQNSNSLDEAKTTAAAINSVHCRMSAIVRSMLQRLRPPELSLLGLQGAVEELFHDWSLRHPHHQSKLIIEGEFDQLDETRQLTTYRIVQECLTNISRHAGNRNLKVQVSLHCQQDSVYISISDNGNGCQQNRSHKGFGLTGMRERVEALAGSFKILTGTGNGFTLTVTFPKKSNTSE